MKKYFVKITSFVLALIITVGCVPFALAETEYKTGDIVYYGSYPKSKITDADTISALNEKAGNVMFNSFGYYSSKNIEGYENKYFDGDNNIAYGSSDYMQYADVCLNGDKYRGVKLKAYRPDKTYNSSTQSVLNSNYGQYGYSLDTVYWFKFEPISWKILDAESGLMISEDVIDAQAYRNSYTYEEYLNKTNGTSIVSEYADSSIKEWLNSQFYSSAFSSGITLKNDEVLLPSYDMLINESYGFYGENTSDVTREVSPTDYAKVNAATNAYLSTSDIHLTTYWTNTPYTSSTNDMAYQVNFFGRMAAAEVLCVRGVRPVISIDFDNLSKHAITYTVGDRTNTDIYSFVYSTGDSLTGFNPPEKEGYTFGGWDSDLPKTMPDKDLYYSGTMNINSHILTFDAAGGLFESGDSKLQYTLNYSENIDYPKPAREGYIFSEWDNDIKIMPDSDITINAVWAPKTDTEYTVKTYLENANDNGYTVSEVKLAGTTDTTAEVTPETIEHFTLNEEKSTLSANINGDGSGLIEIYYDREQFPVYFTFNYGSYAQVRNFYKYGQTVTAPEIPEREGYVTEGWKTTDGNSFASVCEGQAMYSLTWEKGKYQVTVDTDGGSYINNITARYGDSIESPAIPERTGYEFVEWYCAETEDHKLPETMPAKNLTLKAIWEKKTYKLTYVVDGKPYFESNIPYDDAISIKTAPAKTGYTLKSDIIPEKMPAEDTVINAEYVKNTYKVSYVSDGKVIATFNVLYDESIPAPKTTPSKAGYTFKGWNAKIPENMPAKDLTFTAVYEKNASVNMLGYRSNRTEGYKTTITFHAEYSGSNNAELIWIYNDKEYKDDGSKSFTVSSAKSSYTIRCKVVDGNKSVETSTESVKIKTGFFDKIIWFFRSIFAKTKLIIDQK